MLLSATLAILGFWFAFLWLIDPDGFGQPKYRRVRAIAAPERGLVRRRPNREDR